MERCIISARIDQLSRRYGTAGINGTSNFRVPKGGLPLSAETEYHKVTRTLQFAVRFKTL
jgi:hypothetical protein